MTRRRKIVQPYPHRAEVIVVDTTPDGSRTYEHRYPCSDMDCHMLWHTTPLCPNHRPQNWRAQRVWGRQHRIMAKVQHRNAVRASMAYTDRQHRIRMVLAIVAVVVLTALMIASNYM